jgi:hypothetical protein
MRTKTLLLSAVALAAGLLSSQAQSNVYSANIVGYVSVTNAANQYTLLANAMDNGTNDLASLFSSLPNGSQVLVWTGSGYQSSTKLGAWTPNFVVPPGKGFFLKTTVAATNTFVGSVAVANGASVTNALGANLYSLVASPIPFTDTLQGTNLNLQAAVPNGSQVLIWTGSGYQSSTKLGTFTPNFTITPGQGFFVKPNAASSWVQTLNVQ